MLNTVTLTEAPHQRARTVEVSSVLVYKPELIHRYKTAKAAEYRPNEFWRINQYGHKLVERSCMGAVVLLLAAAFVWHLPYFAAWGLVIFMVPLIGKSVGPAKWNRYRVIGDRYYSTQLARYEPIPQPALSLMKGLKERSPDTYFEVEALEQEKVGLDPILYDSNNNAIKVWDEFGRTVAPVV